MIRRVGVIEDGHVRVYDALGREQYRAPCFTTDQERDEHIAAQRQPDPRPFTRWILRLMNRVGQGRTRGGDNAP